MEKFTRGQSQINPAWRWISERGLQVMTGDTTLSRYKALTSLNLAEIEDIIPADGSLLLVFRRGEAISADLRAALAAPLADTRRLAGALHEIAVECGGAAGPDVPALAEQAGMDVGAYINSHYSVAFLGFQPGFPYLHGLPRALHAPGGRRRGYGWRRAAWRLGGHTPEFIPPAGLAAGGLLATQRP